jgi:hypothetical protein
VTDHAWEEGMALLEANLRDADKTPAMKALRGATLRAALDHLTDRQWGAIVQEALRSPTGWFPVLGELEDYAERLPQEPTTAALPDDTRTPEEKREDAKRGLEIVKAAFEERVATLPPRPLVSTPPPGGHEVIASDERLDELRRQAREITEPAEPVHGGA